MTLRPRFKAVKFFAEAAVLAAVALAAGQGVRYYQQRLNERKVLERIVSRLQAESRIAEVIVTGVKTDPLSGKEMTTIKFLEYDSEGRPMWPRYFTFAGNLIQFQSLVVRFGDDFIKGGDLLRGKSLYLFWKAFVLDGPNTQEQLITPVNEIPDGYKIEPMRSESELEIWKDFWRYALDDKKAFSKGIKNAQVEAPGTRFVPGRLYTLKIEHDGGIRIDVQEIPAILRGETL